MALPLGDTLLRVAALSKKKEEEAEQGNTVSAGATSFLSPGFRVEGRAEKHKSQRKRKNNT